MDVIIGCFLASAALLGIGLLERITAGRTSQDEPSGATPEEALMMTLARR